jgi:hypothetical protein
MAKRPPGGWVPDQKEIIEQLKRRQEQEKEKRGAALMGRPPKFPPLDPKQRAELRKQAEAERRAAVEAATLRPPRPERWAIEAEPDMPPITAPKPKHIQEKEAKRAERRRRRRERAKARRADLERAAAASAADPLVIAPPLSPPPALKPMTGREWFFGVKLKGIQAAHKLIPKTPGQSDAQWARDLSHAAAAEGIPLKWTTLVQYIHDLRRR